MQNRKISVRLAILLGQLFVNGGVIAIIFGVWIMSFVVVAQAKLSVWLILVGVFAGPIIAWPWWSFSKPIWEHWAIKHLNETDINEFYQAAMQSQLAWPRGHIFEKTEFKSNEQKHADINLALSALEDFLQSNAVELDYFKARGVDTKVVDETSAFTKNLRYKIDSSSYLSDLHSDMQTIDNFIARLKKSGIDLQKAGFEERMDWFGLESELTKKLMDIKRSICLIN